MIESENEDITPEWIEWAKMKADWYDPSVATEDEYLGKRQHENSAEEKEKLCKTVSERVGIGRKEW